VGVRRRAGPDVEVHRAALQEDELTERRGIPVTTASRTLLDLAAVLERHRLERALREAELRRLADATSLERLLRCHPRRRGTGTLRSVLASGRIGDGVTRSELEERFLAFVDRAALPRPKVNAHVEIAGRLIECDCVWRLARRRSAPSARARGLRRSAHRPRPGLLASAGVNARVS